MSARRGAFTLVELLVVLAILGILLSLILPAIQAARESGRCSTCQNNLKQVSLALLSHHEAQQHFPSGGWGHEWVGVPGRGSSDDQPGGWLYSVLPYLEQNDLHDLGLNLDAAVADAAYARRLTTPLPIFTCPTRRACSIWPAVEGYVRAPKPYGQVSRVARSDYAINGGSSRVLSWPGPASLAEGDRQSYWKHVTYANGFSGISHLHVGISLAAVDDGTSKTYLVGEKSLDPLHYEDGASQGDNESMYSGYCTDLHRFAGTVDKANPFLAPIRDGNERIDPPGFIRFGSAHYSGFLMAFCDGSVHSIDFDIDPEVHLRYGHRKDGGRPLNVLK
jgi:prepilin-type N-terminal cleavage/methylation domain-containing protein